jgi:hypothetical protein
VLYDKLRFYSGDEDYFKFRLKMANNDPPISEVLRLLQHQVEQSRKEAADRENTLRAEMEVERQRAKEERGFFLAQVAKLSLQGAASSSSTHSFPAFTAFDPTSELWKDYWARFVTFCRANSIPDHKRAQVFLTNQSSSIFKLLSTLSSQESTPLDINDLPMDFIEEYMKTQFDPKIFIVRERYKYWTDTHRKPGETVQELAARIRQDAVTCDFAAIKDPLDEALRTRFMCSVNNEAVLKALFKIKDDDLTFARAIEIAAETEVASQVAK